MWSLLRPRRNKAEKNVIDLLRPIKTALVRGDTGQWIIISWRMFLRRIWNAGNNHLHPNTDNNKTHYLGKRIKARFSGSLRQAQGNLEYKINDKWYNGVAIRAWASCPAPHLSSLCARYSVIRNDMDRDQQSNGMARGENEISSLRSLSSLHFSVLFVLQVK